MPDQKPMWTRCLGEFSVMWVTILLISPVKKRIFAQNDQIWPKIGIFGWYGPGHAGFFGALLVGQLVVVARRLYLARHLFTLCWWMGSSRRFHCGPTCTCAPSRTGRTSTSSWPSWWTTIMWSAWKNAFTRVPMAKILWVLLMNYQPGCAFSGEFFPERKISCR